MCHTVKPTHRDEQVEALTTQQPAPLTFPRAIGIHVQVDALEGKWNGYRFFRCNGGMLPGVQLFLEIMRELTLTGLVLSITVGNVEDEGIHPTPHDHW